MENKKQGSGSNIPEDTEVGSLITGRSETLEYYYRNFMDLCIEQYENLLDVGVCEEQARFVLPQGCMVNWYWTGSLYAYARFFNLRTDPHAQLEIQQLATMVGEIIEPLFPISWGELTKGR